MFPEIRVMSPKIFSQIARNAESYGSKFYSLCSRRLEVVGTRKKRAREKETREGTRVSPSRAPVLSFTHYFQAPATPARNFITLNNTLASLLHIYRAFFVSSKIKKRDILLI